MEIKAPKIEPIKRGIWGVLLPYDNDEVTRLWMSLPTYESLCGLGKGRNKKLLCSIGMHRRAIERHPKTGLWMYGSAKYGMDEGLCIYCGDYKEYQRGAFDQ